MAAAAPFTRPARDYLRFLQMLLHGGELNGARILRPETVALINRNHIGDLQAGSVPSRMPERAHRFRIVPGHAGALGARLHAEPAARAERPQRR